MIGGGACAGVGRRFRRFEKRLILLVPISRRGRIRPTSERPTRRAISVTNERKVMTAKYRPVFLSLMVFVFGLTLPGVTFGQQTAEDFVNRGVAKGQKGDMDGALADLTKAITLNPKSAVAYSIRGLAKGKKGDLDGAMADCNRAIELDPKYADAYLNRGGVKTNKGDLDGAVADYTKAIALNPRDAEAYNNRGGVKYARHDPDGAIADYSKAIELNPYLIPAYTNRGEAKKAKGDRRERMWISLKPPNSRDSYCHLEGMRRNCCQVETDPSRVACDGLHHEEHEGHEADTNHTKAGAGRRGGGVDDRCQ